MTNFHNSNNSNNRVLGEEDQKCDLSRVGRQRPFVEQQPTTMLMMMMKPRERSADRYSDIPPPLPDSLGSPMNSSSRREQKVERGRQGSGARVDQPPVLEPLKSEMFLH